MEKALYYSNFYGTNTQSIINQLPQNQELHNKSFENVVKQTTPPLDIKIKTFSKHILNKIESCKKELDMLKQSDAYDKEERIYVLSKNLESYQKILETPIYDEVDYNYLTYIYNDGNLKDYEEVIAATEFRNEEKQKLIRESFEYNDGYHPYIVFIGSMILFSIIMSFLLEGGDFVKGFFSWCAISSYCLGVPTLLFSAIVTFMYAQIHASDFGVSIDPDLVQAVAVTTAATVTTHAIHKYKSKKQKINKEEV